MPPRRWKTRVLLPGLLFGAVLGVLAYGARDVLLPSIPVRVVPVISKTVAGGGGSVTVQAPGWVEADPYARAVSALTDGIVSEVLALEGEAVAAGQIVAKLVDDDARLALRRASAELDARDADVATAEATLLAAQREWDHPFELQRRLAAAEATLAEKRAELARLPLEVAAEAAKLAEQQAAHLGLQRLFDGQQLSELELERSTRRVEAQRAALDAMRARGPVLDALAAAAAAEARAAKAALELRIPERRAVDESTADLERARAASAGAAAMCDEAKLRLARTEIRSPSDGVVMIRLVEPGSKLMLQENSPTSAQVVRLYDPRHLQVRVDVPLADAATIVPGQRADVVVHVLPDRTFAGRVTRFVHEADLQKNTLQVKVAIENPTPEIKPEMLARVRFLATASADASGISTQRVFVPEALVQKGADGRGQVWLADQVANRAELRAVTLGHGRIDGEIEIVDGLQPGDRVIVDPPPSLRAGKRIAITAAAHAPAVGANVGH